MKNIQTISVKKSGRISPFLSLLLLLACNQKEAGDAVAPEPTGPSPVWEQVTLTQEQFQTSDMELGIMQEYSFGTSTRINGTIDVPPEGRTQISSYYGGYVRDLLLLTGQQVVKGERLFTLENPEYVQMQQDYLEAQSQLAYLRSDFERQQTLSQENIASQKIFLKSQAEYNGTLARVQGLKKMLSLLNLNSDAIKPENLRSSVSLVAPFSGYITEINVLNGTFLSPTQVAVSMISTAHIHLDLNVFEKNISSLEKGQSIRFRIPDVPDRTYEAEVFLIGKTVDPDDRMINVHAHLKDESQNDLFTPGMYVEAEIYATNGVSKALPEEAVVEVSGQFFVLCRIGGETREMVFEKKEVNAGQTANGWIEILNSEDFKPSDEFLVKGAFNLIN